MYKKLLVALDRSAISDKVFDTALFLAKNIGAELNLVNVLSFELASNMVGFTSFTLSDDSGMLEEVQEHSERLKRESLENLQYLVKKAKEAGVDAKYNQLFGDPAKAICEEAQEWDADLILMGRRGHSTVSELFLGSISSAVIHRCHCAVHLVQI